MRGLARNLSAEVLKVTRRLSAGEHLHLDTLDLYQARARSAFVKAAALELGVAEPVIAGDLAALVLALEPVQEAAIRGALAPDAAAAVVLSAAEEAAGLALLRDPALAERIVADVEAIVVVGEGTNALVGYLAMVSRLLAKPLAINETPEQTAAIQQRQPGASHNTRSCLAPPEEQEPITQRCVWEGSSLPHDRRPGNRTAGVAIAIRRVTVGALPRHPGTVDAWPIPLPADHRSGRSRSGWPAEAEAGSRDAAHRSPTRRRAA